MAHDMASNHPKLTIEGRLRCYSYGSPRVGNLAFRADYNKRVPHTYRVVNHFDFIPR